MYIEMPWIRPNFPPAAIAFPSVPPDTPPVGRYFVAGLAFSLRWWEFSIIPLLGLAIGVATAGASAFDMATIVYISEDF